VTGVSMALLEQALMQPTIVAETCFCPKKLRLKQHHDEEQRLRSSTSLQNSETRVAVLVASMHS
jgi:hypothetical protein